MKILYIITGLGMGGAEKQVCSLVDYFAEKDNEVLLVSLTGDLLVKPKSHKVKSISLNMDKNIYSFFSTLKKLYRIILEHKPDIIHSHMFHANILTRLAALFSLKTSRLICTAHNKNEGGAIRMGCYRFTDWMCEITTNVSKEALDNFIRLKAFKDKKSQVIYNGIDFNLFTFSKTNRSVIRQEFGIKENDTVILSVGRLTEAKDFPNLFNAFKKISNNKLTLVVVGDGVLNQKLKVLADELHLKDRIIFAGLRNDVNKFYSAADIFVLPSRWEGFGLVVAEAMGTLCPVVATNAGGVSEVVGDNNLIVPINNSTQLADKITTILALSNEHKSQMLMRNYEHVIREFSINGICAQWQNLYNQLKIT